VKGVKVVEGAEILPLQQAGTRKAVVKAVERIFG